MKNVLQLRVPPDAVLLIWAFVIWLLHRTGFGSVAFAGQRWLAALLLLIGLTLVAAGISAFRRARTTVNPLHPDRAAELVTEGVYSLTRNPMYLGMALLLFSLAVLLGSVPGFLLAILFMVYLTRFQIIPEERILRHKFGEAFQRYSQRVRRWL